MADTAPQSSQARWQLVRYEGSTPVERFPMTGDVLTIGRELDNDVSLDSLHVSKYHARITRQDDALIIEDLNSANGTQINDEPIDEPYFLQPDDRLTIGAFEFRIQGPARPIPQSRVHTRAYQIIRTKSGGRTWLVLAVIALLALIAFALFMIFGGYLYFVTEGQPVAEVPQVGTRSLDVPSLTLNQGPVDNAQLPIRRPVTVQALASDPTGVTRMEFWVDGEELDRVKNPLTDRSHLFTAAFRWTPTEAGPHSLQIRAYNQPGLAQVLNIGPVTVIGEPETPTPEVTDTPTPTITPLPPSPTPTVTPAPTSTPIPPTATPAVPRLAVNAGPLDVRAGPGTQYRRVGQLQPGSQAEIVGRTEIDQGRWWQVRFEAGPGQVGWVADDPSLMSVTRASSVPVVGAPSLTTATPTPTPTPTATPATIIRAPDFKTLLIVSNRSIANQPARLTLSGGKSVGGGKEIDVAPNSEVQLVLEPDEYRALWSSPARDNFVRGADFTASAGKVIVMWIVPEDGLTSTEVYDQLVVDQGPAPAPAPSAQATPVPAQTGYIAPFGRALLVMSNRSVANAHAVLTLSGGTFGGGQQITLDANTEIPFELAPGSYRAIWTAPIADGFAAGRDFSVIAGEVIMAWIIPEDGQVFMQFPGQSPQLISN